MGQQQLLLLVLSVIIVGIAIVVGLGMFAQQNEKANVDMVVNELMGIAGFAQQYYYKPTSMGGGGMKFTGLTLDELTGGKSSPNGTTFTLLVNDSSKVTVTGLCGTAKKKTGLPVDVVCTVTAQNIQTKVNY